MLEHANVEVAERLVALGLKGDMALVLVSAAGEEDGQVAGTVRGGVAEVAGEEHLRGIKQSAAGFGGAGEFFEKARVGFEFLVLVSAQLLDLVGILAVVGRVVVLDLQAGDVGEVVLVGAEHDHAGRVGLQSGHA